MVLPSGGPQAAFAFSQKCNACPHLVVPNRNAAECMRWGTWCPALSTSPPEAEKRHKLYKLLRLRVLAHPDKTLKGGGAIVFGGGEGPRGGWKDA
jgi:hypothetical protein